MNYKICLAVRLSCEGIARSPGRLVDVQDSSHGYNEGAGPIYGGRGAGGIEGEALRDDVDQEDYVVMMQTKR